MIVVGRHVFFRAVLRWGAALAFCYPLKHRERFWLRGVENDFVQVGDARLEISRRQKAAFMTAVASYLGGVL